MRDLKKKISISFSGHVFEFYIYSPPPAGLPRSTPKSHTPDRTHTRYHTPKPPAPTVLEGGVLQKKTRAFGFFFVDACPLLILIMYDIHTQREREREIVKGSTIMYRKKEKKKKKKKKEEACAPCCSRGTGKKFLIFLIFWGGKGICDFKLMQGARFG